MGWFDESDDDEEPEAHQEKFAFHEDEPLVESADPDRSERQQRQDDEEDPLDAYMKTLPPASANDDPENDDTANEKATRLDLDNEEEAISHWEANNRKRDSSVLEQDEDEEDRPTSARSAQARQALHDTFHKAHVKESDNWTAHVASQPPLASITVQRPFEKSFWTVTDTHRGHEWRQQHHVTCRPSLDPVVEGFAELGDVFGSDLVAAIDKAGFQAPTLVQAQTLPVALAGHDAVITAATGQGKTLAYIWPAAVHIRNQPPLEQDELGPMVLVLVPTRELALQVHKQAKPMLNAINGAISKAVIGGQGKWMLRQELKRSGKGVQLVVATPGRLLDVLSDKKGLSLNRVTMVVLDEADKMLQMGFEAQVRQILGRLRTDRQTLLLSATMGRKVERVAQEWVGSNYARISVGRTGESSRNVVQHAIVLPNDEAKHEFLFEMLPTFVDLGRTLVFVATRDGVESLASRVRDRLPDIAVDTLHGDKHQVDRNAALKNFSRGNISVLIATDVASRGLDVPQVSTVVNFDAAKNLDVYVHRIGRAGRLQHNEQQTGSAYSLLTPRNADFAMVLRNAFEREGRVVDPELNELAHKSKRSGNVATRNRYNKSGLGFDDAGDSATNSAMPFVQSTPMAEPPAKRSRWGPGHNE